MNEQDLLKYCFFYKGEAIIPPTFDKKNEGKLWVAEKYVCEEIPNLIDKEIHAKVLHLLFLPM